MKVIGAYVLTDIGTEKFYVGSSGNVDKRFYKHFNDLKNIFIIVYHYNYFGIRMEEFLKLFFQLKLEKKPTLSSKIYSTGTH